ncbi:MAG: CocE/NonD family hydrolase [Spirochaetes bacterium]|nr:CocE/NonD family hydrolase [Spirochaetota bacterium]
MGSRIRSIVLSIPAIVLFIILSVSGCNVIDVGTTPVTDSTTLGTRGTLSQTNTPITANADAKWTHYQRDTEYPGAVGLPLQFIDTLSGDTIAALVSVPADSKGDPVPGQFPVILTQNAYRIDMANLMGSIVPSYTTLMIGGRDDFMIRRGYITVAVDVRGTGMSSGVTHLIGADEQADYADVVDWIAQQPWFDGNLGLAGTSYLGIASMLTAAQQDPVVKAVFAVVPMGDAYRGTVIPGGMLNAAFINVWLTLTQNLSVANDPAKLLYPQFADLIEAATQDHIAAIDEWYLPTINNSLADQPGYSTDDGDFWAVRSPVENARNIQVPTFIIGGTNDIFQRCEPLLYEQLKNNVTAKLLIAPGAHLQAILEAMVTKKDLVPGSESMLLQWFDHYLKGMDTGVESLPNVTQYVEGYGGSYATATDWPHPKAAPQRFYLHGNMRLDTTAPVESERSHTMREPEAPSIEMNVVGGTNVYGEVTIRDGSDCSSSAVQWTLGMAGLIPQACYTNNETVDEDALVYETVPFGSDMYINGPMQADIWMSATRSEAAVAVRISDVDAYGKATPISTGLQSAAYRAVDTSRSRYVNGVMVQPWHPFTAASHQPLNPDEPVLVQVEIFPAAALVRAGHRLRISISPSNQEEGVWPLPKQAIANGNVSTIYNDPEHPSSLVVLVVPAGELK